jgi:hypothetical protein
MRDGLIFIIHVTALLSYQYSRIGRAATANFSKYIEVGDGHFFLFDRTWWYLNLNSFFEMPSPLYG